MPANPTKIAHLTSVHKRYDPRIYQKECRSLSHHNYDVFLIVADGLGSKDEKSIKIADVGLPKNRPYRIIITTRLIFKKAININADIYHLHDPELLPIGLKLKRRGKIVIFDSHEDVGEQLLGKHYMHILLRTILSKLYRSYEKYVCRKLDAIITATPFIRDKFLNINKNTIDVNNFPIIGELSDMSFPKPSSNAKQVCYVGGIAEIRGIKQMVRAMEHTKTDVRLALGGTFAEQNVSTEVRTYAGWNQVDELGWLSRNEIKDTFNNSIAGLVTLLPITNYIDSLPVKMFEYMSAGIPVIASDFPLWRNIIEKSQSGVCVNPLDPQKIAEKIDYLVENPEIANKMGKNGRKAVLDIYNWSIEETKLLLLYKNLIHSNIVSSS